MKQLIKIIYFLGFWIFFSISGYCIPNDVYEIQMVIFLQTPNNNHKFYRNQNIVIPENAIVLKKTDDSPTDDPMTWLPVTDDFTTLISTLNKNGYKLLYQARWLMSRNFNNKPISIVIDDNDKLYGSITFSHTPWLLLQANINYAVEKLQEENSLPQYAFINQARRINLDKLTYFDNPEIGMLIQVSPIINNIE